MEVARLLLLLQRETGECERNGKSICGGREFSSVRTENDISTRNGNLLNEDLQECDRNLSAGKGMR